MCITQQLRSFSLFLIQNWNILFSQKYFMWSQYFTVILDIWYSLGLICFATSLPYDLDRKDHFRGSLVCREVFKWLFIYAVYAFLCNVQFLNTLLLPRNESIISVSLKVVLWPKIDAVGSYLKNEVSFFISQTCS